MTIPRRQLVFVTAVFSAVATGFVLEQQRKSDPLDTISSTAPQAVELPPVVLPPAREELPGRVLDERGRGLAGVGVHLYRTEHALPLDERPDPAAPRSAEPLPWARTDAGGRFRIDGAPPGAFRVALLAPGREVVLRDVELPLANEGGVEWQVQAVLGAPEALPEITSGLLGGRVSSPVGDLPEPYPVDGYEVWLEPLGEEQGWLSGAVPRRVQVDSAGRFELPELVHARYLVRVLPAWAVGGTWPVLEELAYTHEAPEPGASARILGVRLRGGTLGGRLFDGESGPLEGALVKVWPLGQPDRLWPSRATDAQGEFLVRDLPPGDYRVRLRAGTVEYEEDVTIRIGARTILRPPALRPPDPEAAETAPRDS